MVAWPPTTVAWPFSDFFENFPKLLETSKRRCLTVRRRSRDLNHCHVTVQRLFSKFSQIDWNVPKTLFDSRPTVAWPPTTVAWPFSDFFQKNSNCLKRRKNVVWQSADSRVTSDHCRVTVQRLFSKILPIAWYLGKQLFDSRPTVASPPTWLESRTNFVWKSVDCHVTVRLLCSRSFFSYGFTYCLADVYLVSNFLLLGMSLK